MNLFEFGAKTSTVQKIIDDLNNNIDEMNIMLSRFMEYVTNLDFDGDVADLMYLNEVKTKMDGFMFIINDRLSLLKDDIFYKVILFSSDQYDTVIDYIDALKKELIKEYTLKYKKSYNIIFDSDNIEIKVIDEGDDNNE